MEIRTVKPKEIIVKDRSRKDLGDIERLATSIEQIGLLHPPVVTSDLLLIAGERRLEAIKMLKWSDLPVHVVSTLAEAAQLLQAERDENTCRKDLAPSEAVALGVKLETIEAPKAQDRREATQGRPPKTGGNLPPVTDAQPKTRDVVGAAVGMSGKTYQKAKAVVEAAQEDPEKFGKLAENMDKSGKVDRAYKAVRQMQKAEQRAEQAAQIAVDPALIFGDFRISGADLQDECTDLVFTDPPYDEDAVQLYRDLGIFARRVLKPGGVCIAYSGHAHLPQVMNALAESLEYAWTCAIRHTGGELRFRKYNIRNGWKPLVMFYKPPLDLWWDWFSDMTSGGKEKEAHDWQQAEAEAAHYIDALCPAGGLVVDPFAGGATTLVAARDLGLRYIGFEIEQDAYNAAQVRLANK
jgi:ParB-like chromosome segregation protein Spo0J